MTLAGALIFLYSEAVVILNFILSVEIYIFFGTTGDCLVFHIVATPQLSYFGCIDRMQG